MRTLPTYRWRAVHLVAAWAFAVSQPIYSLLEGNPEFLVVRGATRAEVVVFALLLTFVPPLVATGCAWIVSRVWRTGGDLLYLVFLAAFLVPLVLLVQKELGIDSSLVLFVAPVVAFGAVFAYARWRPVQLLLTYSSPLLVVGLVLFVARVPIVTEDVAGAEVPVERETPIVLVVLDELPVTSLLTASGGIDAVRYPNFARLSRGATWYPRATTVHESTTAAVPAIVTGRLPRDGELPTLASHSENLFTLLGESYRFRVKEAVTYLCPKRYCPRPRDPFRQRLEGLFSDVRIAYLHRVLPDLLTDGLPQIDDRWGGFTQERILAAEQSSEAIEAFHGQWGSQPEEYAAFVRGIRRTEPRAILHFTHLILPHSPWHFFPSGRDYGLGQIPVGLVPGAFWSDRPWLIRQAYQRHLLQLGYTDGLLGQLLDRLTRTGIYDRALVVVVADHGMSFVAGERSRLVNRSNIAAIAPVPLFVKYPGQKVGRVDPRPVRTIDILPTIADVLGARPSWHVDGHSLLASAPLPADVSVAKTKGKAVRASFASIERGKAQILRQHVEFGPDWSSLLVTGLDPRLLGMHVGTTAMAVSSPGTEVRIDNAELFVDVDTSSSFLPARVTGTVEGDGLVGRQVAVAVNGRIVAPTKVFRIEGLQRFSALIPERFFREGYNEVELVAIAGSPNAPLLTRIASDVRPPSS
jgi:Sulfatase